MRSMSLAPKTRVEASAVSPPATRKLRREIMILDRASTPGVPIDAIKFCWYCNPSLWLGYETGLGVSSEDYAHPKFCVHHFYGGRVHESCYRWRPIRAPVSRASGWRHASSLLQTKTRRDGNMGAGAESSYAWRPVRVASVGRDHPVRWKESGRMGIGKRQVAGQVDRCRRRGHSEQSYR